jgi:transposase, IS30 family
MEMAYHADFTVATGIPVYFCDPHKQWQRGSLENTNGVIRQHLPKSTDLSVHAADDFAQIARSLNGEAHKTLSFMTLSEKLAELIALTG